MPDQRDVLRNIRTFPQLIKFLRDELDWPIESEDFEELTFDYTPEELGIDTASAAKIQEIKRLRPLSTGQPWGIFFLKFEPKRLPVVALRRVLSRVVLKKRASANSADRAAWQADDLLFVSNYGEGDERQISFAHFSQDGEKADLPTLKVLGWDNRDAPLHLDDVADKLTTNLSWPEDEQDTERWREKWRSAFTLRHREVITTSKALADRLADLAQSIRKRANAVLKIESDKGPLRKLHIAFREALIHDLSEDDFADMYAQTIAYGLLTARVSRPSGLVAENLRDMVPVTNPFLKDLLDSFLAVGGRKGKVDFDELGVNEVVQLLRDANMEAVLRDFGDRNPEEDPAIHFYELFLKEYDPKKRVKRGVFYTPRAVVSYIIRSVDELLRIEFGLEDGLAATTTWGEMAAKHAGLKIPESVKLGDPFVQILDPATGTATFLVEVIDVIHGTLTAKWKQQGLNEAQQRAAWNDYVPNHLLPRLHGYELMMAPYAIAHMKIGLKLYETGYRFGSDERARIYLTNALELPQDFSDRLAFDAPALAHEAQDVNAIKRRQRFTVVIGNPPYSIMSANLSNDAIALIEPFRFVNGERIREKGALAHELNLQDDYIKFFGLLNRLITSSGCGIASYVSNFSFQGSRSLRGMRAAMLGTFNSLRFLNLGGHRADNEFSNLEDQNVFEISQGVCISLLSSMPTSHVSSCSYGRITGDREKKYTMLLEHTMSELATEPFALGAPFYKFLPDNLEEGQEFATWSDLSAIMPKNSCCIITSRDSLVIDFDKKALLDKIARFASLSAGDRSLEIELGYSVKKTWDVEKSKRRLRQDGVLPERVRTLLYRPFDYRLIYYEPHLLDAPARPITSAIDEFENLVLMVPHVTTTSNFTHALISRRPAEKKCCSHDRSTQMFPLWVSGGLFDQKVLNLDKRFLAAIKEDISEENAGEVLYYVYAILYSPMYRMRYGNALRDSFPRIPHAHSPSLCADLVKAGGELATLHLLESPKLDEPLTTYTGPTNPEVEKVTYARDTVWLDKAQTRGFRGVPEAVWNFHIGGYQVCEKWLKDRGPKKRNPGRKLLKADIEHYQRVVVALNETIRLMAEIDRVIEAHGGWPDAFLSKSAE